MKDLKNCWFRGGSYARNFGYKRSSGKWIALCDDEEEWTPNFLETSIKYAYKNNLEFVSLLSIYPNKEEDITHRLYCDYFLTTKYINDSNPLVGAPSTWLMRSYLKIFLWNENSWKKNGTVLKTQTCFLD